MKHEELIRMIEKEKAPVSGMMYALYKNKMVYCPYCMSREDSDGNEKRIILMEQPDLAENLLELHLFDADREYRMVLRRGLNTVSEIIDDRCIQIEDGDFKYEEQIQTLDMDQTGNHGLVTIVNYVTYDEDDLLYIENYRLMEVK